MGPFKVKQHSVQLGGVLSYSPYDSYLTTSVFYILSKNLKATPPESSDSHIPMAADIKG
jgi:hypothetical protein